MTRGKQVAKEFFKDYGGILHTDGYVAYEKDIGTVYKLPTGTYGARNANVAIDVAQSAAVAAAQETGKNSAVIVADWTLASWQGLST